MPRVDRGYFLSTRQWPIRSPSPLNTAPSFGCRAVVHRSRSRWLFVLCHSPRVIV